MQIRELIFKAITDFNNKELAELLRELPHSEFRKRVKDFNHESFIQYAIRSKNIEAISIIHERDKTGLNNDTQLGLLPLLIDEIDPNTSFAPLHTIVSESLTNDSELEQCVLMLKQFKELGADFNIKDGEGCNIIFVAIIKNNLDLIPHLIEFGCNINQKNPLGDSVFDYAARKYPINHPIFKSLLDWGAEIDIISHPHLRETLHTTFQHSVPTQQNAETAICADSTTKQSILGKRKAKGKEKALDQEEPDSVDSDIIVKEKWKQSKKESQPLSAVHAPFLSEKSQGEELDPETTLKYEDLPDKNKMSVIELRIELDGTQVCIFKEISITSESSNHSEILAKISEDIEGQSFQILELAHCVIKCPQFIISLIEIFSIDILQLLDCVIDDSSLLELITGLQQNNSEKGIDLNILYQDLHTHIEQSLKNLANDKLRINILDCIPLIVDSPTQSIAITSPLLVISQDDILSAFMPGKKDLTPLLSQRLDALAKKISAREVIHISEESSFQNIYYMLQANCDDVQAVARHLLGHGILIYMEETDDFRTQTLPYEYLRNWLAVNASEGDEPLTNTLSSNRLAINAPHRTENQSHVPPQFLSPFGFFGSTSGSSFGLPSSDTANEEQAFSPDSP